MEKGRSLAGNLPGDPIGESLTLDEFRSVYRSGGFRAVGLMGDGSGFAVWGQTANNRRVMLVATRSRTRRYFGTPVMAFKLLQDVGVQEFQVELKLWYPREEQTNQARGDVASRMRTMHRLGKKQLEIEQGHLATGNYAELYEEAERKAKVRPVNEAMRSRNLVDSEGRVDKARFKAWVEAEREARAREQR